jgi:hypothetical protein
MILRNKAHPEVRNASPAGPNNVLDAASATSGNMNKYTFALMRYHIKIDQGSTMITNNLCRRGVSRLQIDREQQGNSAREGSYHAAFEIRHVHGVIPANNSYLVVEFKKEKKGMPQKERLENLFSSPKKCVCTLKETYFFFFAVFFVAFFAVFFTAFFFAGAFFTGIIFSPPSFHFTSLKRHASKKTPYIIHI